MLPSLFKKLYNLSNLTQEQLVEYTTLAQREAYLAQEEDRAITNRNDETQFRAKLVGTLAPSQAYNILSNIVAIEKIGEVFKIYLRNLTPISELTKSLILNQANAVGAYSGVERLELVLSNKDIAIKEEYHLDKEELNTGTNW